MDIFSEARRAKLNSVFQMGWTRDLFKGKIISLLSYPKLSEINFLEHTITAISFFLFYQFIQNDTNHTQKLDKFSKKRSFLFRKVNVRFKIEFHILKKITENLFFKFINFVRPSGPSIKAHLSTFYYLGFDFPLIICCICVCMRVFCSRQWSLNSQTKYLVLKRKKEKTKKAEIKKNY